MAIVLETPTVAVETAPEQSQRPVQLSSPGLFYGANLADDLAVNSTSDFNVTAIGTEGATNTSVELTFASAGPIWSGAWRSVASHATSKTIWLKNINLTRKASWIYMADWTDNSDSGTTSAWANYSVGVTVNWGSCSIHVRSKEEEMRDRLRKNLQPEIVTRNRYLWGVDLTEEEVRARTLLLELVGDLSFRRYLRKGFIMVTGKSGTIYKVSGGNNLIISYIKDNKGRYVPNEKFCVQFTYADLPFTDGVIMRKLIIENDEFALRKRANVFKISEADKFEMQQRVG